YQLLKNRIIVTLSARLLADVAPSLKLWSVSDRRTQASLPHCLLRGGQEVEV
ncbi:MAG: hypothetical protein HW389_3825, partial [Bacteroidetes bacterium]|nr:hypothetical protein [Bacteroidota bacterium]